MRRSIVTHVVCALSVLSVFFILTTPLAAQQTATIISNKDNTIYSENGGSSNGAGSFDFAGRTNGPNIRRTLVSFPVSDVLPTNATVTSVRLKMKVTRVPSGAVTATFNLHKVTAQWGEGTSDADANEGSGATAVTNDATWSHRLFGSQTWATAGGDFSGAASGSLSISGTGSVEWTSTAAMVADVQSWLTNPSSNFGWIIIGGEATDKTAKRFTSRSGGAMADAPQIVVDYTTSTSVPSSGAAPDLFELQQNYPNPFNPSTTIKFSIPNSARTTVKVFDLLGNEVATVLDRTLEAGSHSVTMDGGHLTSGIYFYRLQSGQFSAVKKLTLLK